MFKQLFLFAALASCRRLGRRDAPVELHREFLYDTMITLGRMKHGHVIRDPAFFYDFMSLSIEFNIQNLDEFYRANFDPSFSGFTKRQFDLLLEEWVYEMLAIGYKILSTTQTQFLSLAFPTRIYKKAL